MNKKSLLIITGDFYPRPSQNGVCVKNLVDEFKKTANITVISFNMDNQKKYREIDGVKCIFLNAPLQYLCNRFNGKFAKIFRTLRAIKTAFLWLGFSRWYYLKAYKEAIKQYKQQKFDAILSVCYPFSGMLAGFKASKKLNVRHISYILDVYSEAKNLRKFTFFRTKFKAKDILVEKEILQNSYINFVSEGFTESSVAKCLSCDKYIIVGFPLINNMAEDKSVKQDKINVFIGSAFVKMVREPYSLFELFDKSEKLNLVICCRGDFQEQVIEFAESRKNVQVFLDTTKEFAQQKMFEADVMLNVSNENEHQIPSKIFEYFSACKPIINIYKTEKQRAMFNDYPCVINVNMQNINSSTITLVENFCEKNKNTRLDFEQVKSSYPLYSAQYIANKIMEYI